MAEVLRNLHITDKEGTYPPQLARFFREQGLEAIVISSNPYNVSPGWRGKKKEEVISGLKRWVVHGENYKDRWIKDTLFLLFYLQEGGKIEILDLTTGVIDQYLDRKYVVLACLEESWLWGRRKIKSEAKYDDIKGHANGHYVVIYGQRGNQYLVSDPYPTNIRGREGLYAVDKARLFASVMLWNPEIVVVKKG